ncbi:MAG: hypothetical protein AAFY11_13090, partial [Cyanobacteria bacterium J06641_5]
RDLDPGRSLGNIDVHFSTCIGTCRGKVNAYVKPAASIPQVFWTTENPSEPVSVRYSIDDIQRIFDEDENYSVYERNT